MLPLVSGIKITKINIFVYALLLFVISIAPYFLGYFGLTYLIFSIFLGYILTALLTKFKSIRLILVIFKDLLKCKSLISNLLLFSSKRIFLIIMLFFLSEKPSIIIDDFVLSSLK